MLALRDYTILGPIAALGPDFTVVEWAEKLDVTVDDVLAAFSMLNIKPQEQEKIHADAIRKYDLAGRILEAVRVGNHRVGDIAKYVGMHPTTVGHRLRMMEKNGLVQQEGQGPKSRWFVREAI